jgi:hypothetical protein
MDDLSRWVPTEQTPQGYLYSGDPHNSEASLSPPSVSASGRPVEHGMRSRCRCSAPASPTQDASGSKPRGQVRRQRPRTTWCRSHVHSICQVRHRLNLGSGGFRPGVRWSIFHLVFSGSMAPPAATPQRGGRRCRPTQENQRNIHHGLWPDPPELQ